MRQLVQATNPETGVVEWCEVATGQVLQPAPSRPQYAITNVGELLFQQEPAIHAKLLEGRALSWREVAIASDVVLCAVSQESLRLMFGARSVKEIKRAIDTMLAAQHLCKALNPRLGGQSGLSSGQATSAMQSLLTLPGRR